MLITIKTLSGRKISLDFEPTQKINEIKETLQEKRGNTKRSNKTYLCWKSSSRRIKN